MGKYTLTLRTRIYISMLALILISLVVIGVTTIVFFHNQNESYHQERLARKEKAVLRSIQYYLKDVDVGADMEVVRKDFSDKILEVADVNSVDINIFTTKGNVLLSSHPDMSSDDFYNVKIDSVILARLEASEETQIEKTDSEEVSAYSYILNAKNEKVAIVNIPYEKAPTPGQDSLKPFLTTLIEIYLFLLLGASLIAYFLSNYITKGLRSVANHLKQVNINQKNEAILWHGRDEIGTLVNVYNDMLDQLEASASKLAKSERESAWREMAKQVAHEIKNPLTPMKLSVQHLERSLKPDDTDFKVRMERFSAKMIQQIDTLTHIADEFSHFAKMPKAKFESLSLYDIIRHTVDLFANEEGIIISFGSQLRNERIMGDKEQLTRVFNNLIKNAIQAIPDHETGKIEVTLVDADNCYSVEVKDNGTGIPEALRGSIFAPNFTTKSTGTGLGLAMVFQIIESHGASIDFETVEAGEKLSNNLSASDSGTVFRIKFPKAVE